MFSGTPFSYKFRDVYCRLPRSISQSTYWSTVGRYSADISVESRVIFYFVGAAVSKDEGKDMYDDDQNNKSLDSDEDADGSDDGQDEPGPKKTKGWYSN